MKEQLVSSETAQLAKEKGFDWETPVFRVRLEDSENNYMRPSQSLLQKWLRDEHDLVIVVRKSDGAWAWYIQGYIQGKIDQGWEYSSYEEALEAGLQTALKLI